MTVTDMSEFTGVLVKNQHINYGESSIVSYGGNGRYGFAPLRSEFQPGGFALEFLNVEGRRILCGVSRVDGTETYEVYFAENGHKLINFVGEVNDFIAEKVKVVHFNSWIVRGVPQNKSYNTSGGIESLMVQLSESNTFSNIAYMKPLFVMFSLDMFVLKLIKAVSKVI